jgi:CBS domain-containing protein
MVKFRERGCEMLTLRKVLAEKVERGHKKLYTIESTANLKELAERLCKYKVGAMLVTGAGGDEDYIGIISERDILKKCAGDDDFRQLKVADIMVPKDVMVVSLLDENVNYVMGVMKKKHIRHLPLMENSKIVALLSIRDIIDAIQEEQDITITHLSDFACGTRLNEVY